MIAVRVECPECHAAIRVPIAVTLSATAEGQSMTADPDLSDVWAHAWTHEADR